MAARSRSQRSRLSAAGALVGSGAGRRSRAAAILVTSWAFIVLRRCNSSEGKRSERLVVQAPGHLEDVPPGQLLEVLGIELAEGRQRFERRESGPKSGLFRPVSTVRATAAPAS